MFKPNLFAMAVTILVIEYLISSRIYISISPLKLWWDSNGALYFVIKQNMLWKQTMIFLSMFHYSIRLWNTPKKNLLLISTVSSKSYNMRVWIIWLNMQTNLLLLYDIFYTISFRLYQKWGEDCPSAHPCPRTNESTKFYDGQCWSSWIHSGCRVGICN